MQSPGATILSQYANSPTLAALIQDFNAAADPGAVITQWIADVWQIDTAVGFGLDVLGRIVGIGRTVNIGGGYGQQTLADSAYRTLLYAKCLANISDGSIQNINAILMTLFPGLGDCYIIVTGPMAWAVHLAFTPTAVQLAILQEVLPIPVGVVPTWPSISGASLSLAIDAGAAPSANAAAQTFPAQDADASGGSGSYTYAWSYTASTGGTWALDSTTSATPIPSVSSVADGVTATATLHCVVTDTATGGTANANASYSFDNTTMAGSFTVSIQPGSSQSGSASSFTFAPNTVSYVGAALPIQGFLWTEADDGLGVWTMTGGATDVVILRVHILGSGGGSAATLTCTVTDANGTSVTSAPANYSYVSTGGGKQN